MHMCHHNAHMHMCHHNAAPASPGPAHGPHGAPQGRPSGVRAGGWQVGLRIKWRGTVHMTCVCNSCLSADAACFLASHGSDQATSNENVQGRVCHIPHIPGKSAQHVPARSPHVATHPLNPHKSRQLPLVSGCFAHPLPDPQGGRQLPREPTAHEGPAGASGLWGEQRTCAHQSLPPSVLRPFAA